ncbi:MAG: TolC family protein [Pirellulales bacterium]|nr:TolC family protein [Pirellulales bacterium]
MMRAAGRRNLAIAGLLASWLAAAAPSMADHPIGSGCPDAEMLPLVERGRLIPLVEDLPPLNPMATGAEELPEYRGLTPLEAQCLAVMHSALGNLLSNERRAMREKPGLCHPDRVAEIKRRVLAYASAEARNHSGGVGLELYFRLAEAEAKRDILAASLGEIMAGQERLAEAVEQGIEAAEARDRLFPQRTQSIDALVAVDLAIEQLNGQLRRQLGFRQDGYPFRFWPVVELQVTAEPLDTEALVANGLAMRPELNAIRVVGSNLDRSTLPAVRDFLKSISPLLGNDSPESACKLLSKLLALCSGAVGEELAERRAQIMRHLAEREQAVAEEIRQGVILVEARLRLVALAKEKLEEASETLRQTRSQHENAEATYFDVLRATLAEQQARADLISAVVGWEIAMAKLRESQGLLVYECCD